MVSRILFCITLSTLISGCASMGKSSQAKAVDTGAVRTFAEVYRRSKEADARDTAGIPRVTASLAPALGYVKPYVPVIRPPRVIKVWVPAHVIDGDPKALVAGHWAFVMLEDTRWFIEGEEKPECH